MKQILLINDVVGHSHVGMVAMLPILTYQGHSVFNLPTALVSNTLDYGHFNVLETTDYMRGTLPVWQQLGFRFDAVCTGLMFSEEQARLVVDYCKKLKDSATQPLSHSATSPTTVFVDPIMGDGGRLYNGMGQRQVELMREMVSVADLTFPNYTEACYLADVPFRQEGLSWDEVCALLDTIVALGARSVVITSAKVDGHSCVVGRRSDKPLSGFPQHHDDARLPRNGRHLLRRPHRAPHERRAPARQHPGGHACRQSPHRPQPRPEGSLLGHSDREVSGFIIVLPVRQS